MQLNIKQKNENSFLKRTEVTGTVTFSGATPSNNDVAAAVGKAVGKGAENVVIRKIKTIFSQNCADVEALVYHTADAKKSTEPMTKHMKKKLEEEAKKAKEGQ